MALEVLLVDDEPTIRSSVADTLRAEGHSVRTAGDGEEAISILGAAPFDVVLCDVRLPRTDGITVFRQVRRDQPAAEVILMTAFATVPEAVAALKEGATDYLSKPFEIEQLIRRLEMIDRRRILERELSATRAELATSDAGALVGRCAQMVRVGELLDTFAESDAPVLISGESGTGKEVVARALHEKSPRRIKPMVSVNCAAFPETLLEAELFGHERGAFTGAVRKREGRFRAAHGGTLFLDEVGEIPLPAQAKLLRVLQEGTFEPLGTNQTVSVNVRIISATNRNLARRIAEGQFREDLFYRLNVLPIELPPLRERSGDLPLLVETFLRRYSPAGRACGVTTPAWSALSSYRWPGNVRELEHAIQHAVVLARGADVDVGHLPPLVAGALRAAPQAARSFTPLAQAAREFEREHIVRALQAAGGKKVEAAQLLGISRKNLWEKIHAHALGAEVLEAKLSATERPSPPGRRPS